MSVETSSNAMSLPIRKSFVLGVLYFIQGLPYGLQDKFIPLMLIMKGHSHSTVALTRLLLLPWLMKPLFAPLIDTTLTKVKWVTSCLISLSVISLLNATLVPEWDGTNSISTQLIGTLFALNLFSAVQDIAVDAIAINILTNGHEVASGNAAQIVGYKLGALFGSGILFWIYSSFGWTGLFLCLFFVYTTVLIIHLVSQRPLSLEGNNHTNINQKSNGLPSKPNLNWTRGLSPEIIQLVLYLLLYKLGESAACTTFPFFLTKSGVTNHEIAFWNGIIAMLCSILGSTIASQLSLSRLRTVIKLRLLPLFVQLLLVALAELAHVEHHLLLYYGSILSLLCLHLIGGLITTLTFSLMMSTCQTLPESYQATRYTLLSSVEVFGKLMFTSLSGICIDLAGFTGAHIVYLFLSILPLRFLIKIKSD